MKQNTNDLLSPKVKDELRKTKWSPTNLVDLHKMGVHYHDPSFLPHFISPQTYNAYVRSGLTPPVTLPTYFPSDVDQRIEKFLNENFYKLSGGGIQYLGNEANVMPASQWDKAKCRICIMRLSEYQNIDGAFGQYLISNFIGDFSDDIFVDFAYHPEYSDVPKMLEAGIPLVFSNTMHKALRGI